MSSIVTFGKYKGKEIEAMHQDHVYMAWLLKQDWYHPPLPPLPSAAVCITHALKSYNLLIYPSIWQGIKRQHRAVNISRSSGGASFQFELFYPGETESTNHYVARSNHIINSI